MTVFKRALAADVILRDLKNAADQASKDGSFATWWEMKMTQEG